MYVLRTTLKGRKLPPNKKNRISSYDIHFIFGLNFVNPLEKVIKLQKDENPLLKIKQQPFLKTTMNPKALYHFSFFSMKMMEGVPTN